MSFEDFKQMLKKIERQESMCHARKVRLRESYKRKNEPIHLRKHERINVRLRVTDKTREALPDDVRNMQKYQLGKEYCVTGYFEGWYIHEDGNGELKPILYGDVSYSRFDDIISIEIAEQADGICSKCRHYKDGYCYLAGGKNLGKSCATHKVVNGDLTCPEYEELTELWDISGEKHYPNVTIMKNKKPVKYRIYSLNWDYYTEYGKEIIDANYRFEISNRS